MLTKITANTVNNTTPADIFAPDDTTTATPAHMTTIHNFMIFSALGFMTCVFGEYGKI